MTHTVLVAAGSLVLGVLAAAAGANAQPTAQPAAAQTCMSCHGTAGVSAAPNFPNLAGQKAAYLEAQLKAFKSKSRVNPFMNPIAAQLSDEDIHGLALYWSALPANGAPGQTAAIAATMKMPAGFPAGFTQYQDKATPDGGRVKRYANPVALKAARAGQPLPLGSIVVGVSYDKTGAVASSEGMESRKDWTSAVPPLLKNGDFQYGRWDKTGQPVQFNQTPCLACHKGKEADSFMFSHKELTEAKE